MDADGAGKKATERALNILGGAGLKSRVIRIPDGKDPDEFIKKHGIEGATKFSALLEGAANDTEYRLFCAAEGLDFSVDRDRVAYLEKTAQILGELSSSVEADVYAGRIADQCGISKQALLQSVKRKGSDYRRKERARQVKEVTTPVRTDAVNPKRPHFTRWANAEEGLLAVLMRNPDFVSRVATTVSPDDFMTDFNRKVYEELVRRDRENASFDLTLMGSSFTGEELGRLVHIQARGQQRENSLEECALCYQIMREEKLKASLVGGNSDSDEDYIQKMTELAKNKNKGVTEQ